MRFRIELSWPTSGWIGSWLLSAAGNWTLRIFCFKLHVDIRGPSWIIAVAFVAAAVAGQVRPCLTRTRPLLMKWHQMLLIEPFLFSKHEGCWRNTSTTHISSWMACNYLVLRSDLLFLTEDEVEWKYPEHPSSKAMKTGSLMFVFGMD